MTANAHRIVSQQVQAARLYGRARFWRDLGGVECPDRMRADFAKAACLYQRVAARLSRRTRRLRGVE